MKSRISKILAVVVTLTVLASMFLFAVPVAALSVPQVTIPPAQAVVSGSAVYSMTFNAGVALPAGGQIVVTFPAGTTFGAALVAADVQFADTAGIGGGPTAAGAVGAIPCVGTQMTITLGAGQTIGAGSLVQLIIGTVVAGHGVINPPAAGSYTLTVGTQTVGPPITIVEAPVVSSTYTIINPVFAGLAQGYNVSGVMLVQSFSINTAIGTAGVVKVVAGPGTYVENVVANVASQTIVCGGAAGTATIAPAAGVAVTISALGVIFDGFTATGVAGQNAINVTATGDNSTIKNCAVTVGINAAGGQGINITALAPGVTISNTTINATGSVIGLTGIVLNDQAALTGDTINVSGLTTAVHITAGGTALVPTTLTNCTITGVTNGTGVLVDTAASVSIISGGTLSALDTAVQTNVAGANVTISGNTIQNCASVVPNPAIRVTNAASVLIYGNTFTGNQAVLDVAVTIAPNVFMVFNTLTGNTGYPVTTATQATGTVIANSAPPVVANLVAANNWWGAAAGPAAGAIGPGVIGAPYLVAAVTNPVLCTASPLQGAGGAPSVAGVNVVTIGAPTVIGAAQYATNPFASDAKGEKFSTSAGVPVGATPLAYYDVFIAGAPTNATINFFGAVTVTPLLQTMAYAWSPTLGWVACSGQAPDSFSGAVTVNVIATSTPSLASLATLEFATANTTLPPAAPVLVAPLNQTVSQANVGFNWGAVAGATYNFQLANNSDFTTPIVDKTGLTSAVYGTTASLNYASTYYWRVQAVTAGGNSAWTVGTFTTVAVPGLPVYTCPVDGLQFATQAELAAHNATAHAPVGSVTPAYIWAIIAVGAVLIIAVLVLIVRARRP
jgi:hypothetical protein